MKKLTLLVQAPPTCECTCPKDKCICDQINDIVAIDIRCIPQTLYTIINLFYDDVPKASSFDDFLKSLMKTLKFDILEADAKEITKQLDEDQSKFFPLKSWGEIQYIIVRLTGNDFWYGDLLSSGMPDSYYTCNSICQEP